MTKNKRKVLLIGWDAADWKIIDQLMESGLMPAMKSLVDRGVRGRLATMDPPLSPMLWTSMATGVRPFKHGVLGFVEADGHGGVRPVSSHSRKVKAIWNMLSMEGYTSNIVGWWPSNPVESINGCMVSNLFQQEKKGKEIMDIDQWEMPEGTIFPERIKERLMELRVHPHEITGNLVMPFVPQALTLDKKKDKRLVVIAKILAHATTIHGACTELMETEPWDFTAVYHDAIDHLSHAFMKYNPPRMEGLDEEAFELFKDVVKGAYVFHDMMLDRLLKMVDEDTTVIVVSDHGFHSDNLRPKYVPKVPSGPAVEHAPYGIFAAMGPGIKKGERIHGARVLDLTPTLLALYDLPIGRDMDGKPLMDIFEEPPKVTYIDSWEQLEKEGGQLVTQSSIDEAMNEAALQQLIDLGYIDDMDVSGNGGETSNEYLRNVIRENNFYLAKSYANGQKFDEALELLLEIEDRQHPDFRYLLEIIHCAIKTKRFALAEEYLAFLKQEKILSENYLLVVEAKVQFGLNNPNLAVKCLEQAMKSFPEAPDVLIEMGKLYTVVRELGQAKKCFERSIELDPDSPFAYHGLGVAALRSENYEMALSNLLTTVEKSYHFPQAHFHLGECLVFMKEYDAAIHSFEVVAAMAPNLPKTFKWLKDIHEILGNKKEALHYAQIANKMKLGEKIIVSGLPGAKLRKTIESIERMGIHVGGDMDDMLGEGIQITEKNWFARFDQKVCYLPMKIIGSLPAKYDYTFLFVQDELNDVVDEITRVKQEKGGAFDSDLYNALTRQLHFVQSWFGQQPDLDIFYLQSPEDLDSDFFRQYIK